MVKILLGSTNLSKKESIQLAFAEIGINDIDIEQYKISSDVSSKPINEETIYGAKNRNKNLKEYATINNINYDYLISIEGGYEQIDDNNYYIVTYASIYDKNNNIEVVGKSQGLAITKRMFEWVKKGNSLNKVIENILKNNNNKKRNGISGYLTNGYYYRSVFDSTAVISGMECLNNIITYNKLDEEIEKREK